MRRFQAVKGEQLGKLHSTWWYVWDWKHQRTHDEEHYISRFEAKRRAKFLHKHQWLVK